ncbi:shikimate kinase [Roseivivax sp. CAU 1761]
MAERRAERHRRLMKTVVLIGMMGAGKTAVGRALAGCLGVDFVDSDHEIERAANMTIAEIFARDGEAFFRQKEAQVIARLLDGVPRILATGGGAFLRTENRDSIAARGVSVWLDADLDLLWTRVRHKETRPLLRTPDPYGTLAALYEARTPIYAKADLAVKVARGAPIDRNCAAVVAALATRPDVLEETA